MCRKRTVIFMKFSFADKTLSDPALRRFAAIMGCVVCFAVVPYMVSAATHAPTSERTPGWKRDLIRLRAWQPDEGIPILRLFARQAKTPAPDVASGGAYIPPQRLRGKWRSEATPTQSDVTASSAPKRGDHRNVADDLKPSAYRGVAVTIEDPTGDSMRPFYRALERTLRGEGVAITRVAHFGDSSIALDGITRTVRRRLQTRFGDSGHGFILITKGSMPYRHEDVVHKASDNWRLFQLVRAGMRERRYGLGGVQFRSIIGAQAVFGTADDKSQVGSRVSRYEVLYHAHPRGGTFEVQVDERAAQRVNTRSDKEQDKVFRVEVPDGPHQMRLRTKGHGETRLYGVVMERKESGVVYDSLGMVGARARRMLGYDEPHFRRQLALRKPDLIALGFGGNDADDRRSEEQFEQDFRAVVRLVKRARPQAGCILLAPLDQAERDERGRVQTMESVPRIVAAQQKAARHEGCAFFNTYEAMGGEGAMRRWFDEHPRLAFGDFRHATPAGYREIGTMFYQALMKGFSEYLANKKGR